MAEVADQVRGTRHNNLVELAMNDCQTGCNRTTSLESPFLFFQLTDRRELCAFIQCEQCVPSACFLRERRICNADFQYTLRSGSYAKLKINVFMSETPRYLPCMQTTQIMSKSQYPDVYPRISLTINQRPEDVANGSRKIVAIESLAPEPELASDTRRSTLEVVCKANRGRVMRAIIPLIFFRVSL
jgi:hypothetical protein